MEQIKLAKAAKQKEKGNEKWEGHLPAISLENEIAAWRYINKAADQALAKYSTLLEEDLEILEKDANEEDEDAKLTKNQKNCVLFRKSEKVILHFLKDCAKRVSQFVIMPTRKA